MHVRKLLVTLFSRVGGGRVANGCGRLKMASKRLGFKVTPHMLRHTFGTQLVNAGADITTIQALLGHSRLNTTMIYARVHDKTVARDYYKAMAIIEKQPSANLNQETDQQPHTNGHHPGINGNAVKLLRLVSALEAESLTERQQAVVTELQQELLALAT